MEVFTESSKRIAQFGINAIIMIKTAKQTCGFPTEDVRPHGPAPVLLQIPGQPWPEHPVAAIEAVDEQGLRFQIAPELAREQYATSAFYRIRKTVPVMCKKNPLKKLYIQAGFGGQAEIKP